MPTTPMRTLGICRGVMVVSHRGHWMTRAVHGKTTTAEQAVDKHWIRNCKSQVRAWVTPPDAMSTIHVNLKPPPLPHRVACWRMPRVPSRQFSMKDTNHQDFENEASHETHTHRFHINMPYQQFARVGKNGPQGGRWVMRLGSRKCCIGRFARVGTNTAGLTVDLCDGGTHCAGTSRSRGLMRARCGSTSTCDLD